MTLEVRVFFGLWKESTRTDEVFQEKRIWYVLCLDTVLEDLCQVASKKKKKKKFEV